MTYRILKTYVGFILKFFLKDVKVTGKQNIPKDKAVMFASFHPNSFLDAIILNCLVDRPVWSLARGDAFKRPWVRDFLHKICMMPIYRISEGKENLEKNDETFDKCFKVFQDNGQVLIFSEGLCTNQTQLLPLKKGTARLALQTWYEGVDVVVIPTAVNYSQYTSIGKKITINFSTPIPKNDFEDTLPNGTNVVKFNKALQSGLEQSITRNFNFTSWRTVFFYLMYALNFPVYSIVKTIVKSKTKGTVFFDSIYLGILVVALPLYWILVASLVYFLA